MGKSTRTPLAAELEQPQNQADFDETSNDSVVLRRSEKNSGSHYDEVVILDSRRRTAESEAGQGRGRSLRQKPPRNGGPNDIGEQIGEQLRSLYDDVLNQPVPDRFLELLNKLETDPISPERSKAPGER